MIIAKAGIYDLRLHHDDVIMPILRHWKIFERTNLGEVGERARDELATSSRVWTPRRPASWSDARRTAPAPLPGPTADQTPTSPLSLFGARPPYETAGPGQFLCHAHWIRHRLLAIGLVLALDVITVDLKLVDDGHWARILIVTGILAIGASRFSTDPPRRRRGRGRPSP